jgi:hypothetical protein
MTKKRSSTRKRVKRQRVKEIAVHDVQELAKEVADRCAAEFKRGGYDRPTMDMLKQAAYSLNKVADTLQKQSDASEICPQDYVIRLLKANRHR